jgi:hypothetical protein
MNNALEKIWKEAVVAFFRDYLGICLDGLRKTMKNLSQASRSPNLRTRDLWNSKKQCQPLRRYVPLQSASSSDRFTLGNRVILQPVAGSLWVPETIRGGVAQ